MKTSQPIIAGIDFSPASPMVLRHASNIAASEGVPLIVLHVVDTSHLSHWLAGRKKTLAKEQFSEVFRKKLTDLVAAEPNAQNAEIIVLSGRPPEEVQTVIDEKGAGLLVIAANDMSKKRLGLTASRIVRTAHCDVLVLRDWQDQRFSRIAVCVDLSRSTAKVIQRGIEIAKYSGAILDIVHVLYPPEKDLWGVAVESESSQQDFVKHTRSHAHSALENTVEPFKNNLEGITLETHILESTSPAHELTAYAQESKADLVILGTSGHSKLGSHFLGTNTERLLQDAPLSVFAVRV